MEMSSGKNRKILINARVHFAGLKGLPGRAGVSLMEGVVVCLRWEGSSSLLPHPHDSVAAGKQLAVGTSILPKGTPRKTAHSTALRCAEAWGRGRAQNLLLLLRASEV